MPKQPNIVLVNTHDTGKELGCYGSDAVTPNLDRIASEGLRFDRMFAVAPQCSPSRASLLTGRYPQGHGLMELTHMREDMACDPSVTLPRSLAAAGYETRLFGFQHECEDPLELGYEKWDTEPENPENTHHYAPKVYPFFERFIQNRSPGDRPFFACIGFHETHMPYERPGYPASDPENVTLPPWMDDTPGNRHNYAHFQGTLKVADSTIGQIDDLLEAHGLKEDTIFIYTTDHGIDFPRAKLTLYDPGLEISLLIRWPGRIDSGSTDDALRSNVDIMPTLLDLVGQPLDDRIDGRSFAPLLSGGTSAGRDAVFAGMTYHVGYNPMRCIRTNRFKFIRYDDPEAVVPLVPDKEWLKDFTPRPRQVSEELFDLETDPFEKQNLAQESEWDEVREQLAGELENWMRETHDPLLDGPVSKWHSG